MARVLITGMSGAGKTTLLEELARRGHVTVDTDYDGWELPGAVWDEPRMDALLAGHADVIVSGTVENQGRFHDRFDHIVLLSAPVEVLLHRVSTRTNNPYGRTEAEQADIREYVRTVEPLLRRSATLELDGRRPVDELATAIESLSTSATSDLLLLPSPLLPASAYDGLAVALTRGGTTARAAPTPTGTVDATRLVEEWSALVGPGTVVIPHSNAGFVAPLVRALATAKASVVFMDASLPPDSGTHPLAPPRFRAHLDGLADHAGLLPAWTRWWPRDAYDDVIPAERFDDVDRDCPRVPLAYFDTHLTAPDGWTSSHNAYLAFGGTYADELARARDHRWPHATLDGGHLQFLVEPDAVADAILALVAELSDR